VNDRHGHEEGDALIKSAAELIASVFRGTDILARLGGDEFAIIAHKVGAGGPEAIRERLRKELELRNCGGTLRHRLLISTGITTFEPVREPEASLDQLLARADALMYEEKQRERRGRAG